MIATWEREGGASGGLIALEVGVGGFSRSARSKGLYSGERMRVASQRAKELSVMVRRCGYEPTKGQELSGRQGEKKAL